MTTKRSTKSALVSATLVLVLCVSALLGTTFAWFTDSVTSGNNIIQSGNLDIGLKYAKIEDGAITGWSDVDDTVKVFDPNALWEPGRVEVVYLEVANLGTLALKYKLGVNIINEDAGTNVAGEEFKLSDHLVFSVVPFDAEPTTAYSREEAIAAAGNSKGLTDYNGATTALEVNGLDYVALIVYMPESVGNEANYREDDMPTIELGVNLYATQQTAENDSFGPDYDEDAVYADKTYTVDSNGSLADTLADINSANDETVLVQLAAPMSWETGAGHGSTPWVDENAAVKELIIDANGNTITATGAGVGPIRMANGGTLVFKNAKIVDESVSYAENSWEFGYLEFQGNVVFENVEFVNAVMVEGDSAIFTNCTFNSNKDNEYAVWVSNGDATFTGCTFAGPRGLKTHEAYGSEVGTIVVDNCTFDNIAKKPGIAIGTVNADTTITIKNSDFINCQAGDQGLFIYETDTDVATFNFTCSDNEVIKHVDSAAGLTDAIAAGEKNISVAAGTYTFPASQLQAGQTITCAPGTVFDGKTSMNINGATVVGATFTNDGGYLVNSNTINGTFKDCVFTDCDGLRYCYAGETVVFENCVFDTDFYGVHFDGGANDVVFKGCTFTGFNTFGGAVTKLTMEDCTFKYNGKGGYNGVNLWGNAELTNCTFVFDGSASYEWVDLCGDNKTVTFTNCVVTDGENTKAIETVVGDYGTGNTIIFN